MRDPQVGSRSTVSGVQAVGASATTCLHDFILGALPRRHKDKCPALEWTWSWHPRTLLGKPVHYHGNSLGCVLHPLHEVKRG